MHKILSALVLVVLSCAACSSTFKTSKFDTGAWRPVGESVEGIVYYEPHQVLITYEFTALVEKGNLIGTAQSGACARIIQKQELVIEPNFNEPRILLNKPSAFSSGKLSVTFSDGVITSINSESNPQIPDLVKAAVSTAKEARLEGVIQQPPLVPACNAAPVIKSTVPFQQK